MFWQPWDLCSGHVLQNLFCHTDHGGGRRDPQKSYPSEISAIFGSNPSGKLPYFYCVICKVNMGTKVMEKRQNVKQKQQICSGGPGASCETLGNITRVV